MKAHRYNQLKLKIWGRKENPKKFPNQALKNMKTTAPFVLIARPLKESFHVITFSVFRA